MERTTAILRLEERGLAAHRFPLSPSRHLFLRPHEWGYAKEREDARALFWLLGRWRTGRVERWRIGADHTLLTQLAR